MSEIIERLERISLFANLKHDPAALGKIAARIKTQTFKLG